MFQHIVLNWKQYKTICMYYFFQFAWGLISEDEKYLISALVLPVFRSFPVLGPFITSLPSSRSSTDRSLDLKCPKNEQNLAEMSIFLLNNGNCQKPKNFNAATSSCFPEKICIMIFSSKQQLQAIWERSGEKISQQKAILLSG